MLVFLASLGKWGILPVAVLLSYFAWYELIRTVEKKYGAVELPMLLTALGCLGILGGLWETFTSMGLGVVVTTSMAVCLPMVIKGRPPAMAGMLVAGYGMFMITLPLAVLVALVHNSYGAFTFLLLIVMANDGSSAVFGGWLGHTRLCPEISPKKTWEGAIGGLFAAILAGYLLQFAVPQWHLWQVLAIAACISVIAQIGDLTASAIKREAGIKDFGEVLYVTGGVLDKFDGLFFALPLFYAITVLIGG